MAFVAAEIFMCLLSIPSSAMVHRPYRADSAKISCAPSGSRGWDSPWYLSVYKRGADRLWRLVDDTKPWYRMLTVNGQRTSYDPLSKD